MRDPQYLKDWQARNKEYSAQYRRDNSEKISATRRRNYARNALKIRAKRNAKKHANLEEAKLKRREYYHRNKATVVTAISRFIRNKKERDPLFKLTLNIRSRISMAIRAASTEKAAKSSELLGCTPAEARDYIQKQFRPGMTWDNNTILGWHIDHIIPVSAFDLSTKDGQKSAFHFTNLQPLWWWENLAKADKIAA